MKAVTVYVEVAFGETTIVAEVSPVLHKYVVPPLAVKLNELPGQIESPGVIFAIGGGTSVTETESFPVHPFTSVTITKYVVLTVGNANVVGVFKLLNETGKGSVHKNETPPVALRIAVSSTQIETLGPASAIGLGEMVTVVNAVSLHPLHP